MTKQTLLLASMLASLALTPALVGAQTAATVSPQKQALVDQVVQAQMGGVDLVARQLVEQPAIQMLQRAGIVVRQKVAPDQQQAMAQALQGDVRGYVEKTFPIVRDRARALAPAALAPVLADKLSEAELQEVLAVFRSDAWRKFQSLAPEFQKSLGDKLIADVKPQVETQLKALDQAMAKRLGIQPPAAASGAGK